MNNRISKPVTNCNNNKYINPDYYSVVVVKTIQERDNIPCKLRQEGMLVILVGEGYSPYQLQTQNLCDNTKWVRIGEPTVFIEVGTWPPVEDEGIFTKQFTQQFI